MATARKLMTLEEVNDRMGRDAVQLDPVDFSNKKHQLDYDGNTFVLSVGKKERKISEDGISYLTQVLDLPKALPKKLATEPDMMTYILNERAKRSGSILSPLKRGSSIVSFVDHSQTLVSNQQVMESIGKCVNGPLFDKVYVGENGVSSFTVVSENDKKMKIGKGDNFIGGVRLENNPMKSSSTKIEAYLERLVCLNGAIAPSAHWSAPRTIDGDVGDWINDNVGYAMGESRKMFKSIAKLASSKIDSNLMDFLENMYVQLKIPETVRDLITRRIVKEGASNMYDIFNHITFVASNYRAIREDDTLSARLMRISGHFAQHIEDVCNSCSRPVLTEPA